MNAATTCRTVDDKILFPILLIAFFLIAYILPLGAPDLMVPDETRYGEIPREMIATGDWVVPHLNGVRYFEKPVLGYWVHAAALLLFGENNFAVRLPSALAVGLSALLICLLAGRARKGRRPENSVSLFLAPLVFLSCFEVFAVGNIAVLDNLFSLFLTASVTAFYFATEERPGSHREKGYLLLAGLACGLALLTKGFLAFAVPVLTLVPYLLWRRRYVDLVRMSWLPLLTAIVVALPWGILIHLREPDFWHFFFWNEHIRRFMADSAQHKESFWFFFMAAPGAFMPWTFVAPAAAASLTGQVNKGDGGDHLVKLCICWIIFPFLFFSLSKGKLLTYILPCFPPFALLTGIGLSRAMHKADGKLFRYGIAATGLLFVLAFLALIHIQVIGIEGFQLYRQPWKAVLLASALLFMILMGFWSLYNRSGIKKVLFFGCSPLLLFFIGHFILPDPVIEESAPGRLLVKDRAQIQWNTAIISCKDAVGAASWFFKRDDVYLLNAAGELDYGMKYPNAAGRVLSTRSAREIIEKNNGNTVLICKVKEMRDLQQDLPPPLYREVSGPKGYEFRRY